MSNKNEILTYYIGDNTKNSVTLDVYEAERYEAALIVQQLVGTLVYYSNYGQYRPRLAEKWYRDKDRDWVFVLREGLICENDEKITADSYVQSLKNTIKILGKTGLPIFEKIKGFKHFITGKSQDLTGLRADENKIIFSFDENISSGLVQMLSFSPFGYISPKNINEDGTWKDDIKLISSGPYKVKQIKLGQKYHLTKNEKWVLENSENSPDEIIFDFSSPKIQGEKENHIIVDIVRWKDSHKSNLKKFELVPEYLNAIFLGNTKDGFFSDRNNREYLRFLLNKEKMNIKWPAENLIPSQTFYPNQSGQQIPAPKQFRFNKENLKSPIVIQGVEPPLGEEKDTILWRILKSILVDNNIPFKFSGKTSWKDASDNKNDIRMRQISIGGGIEVWGLSVVFCSELGNRLPDPTGKICDLIKKIENEKISFETFSNDFFNQVIEDSAILPVYHSGTELYMSEGIDLGSINPTLNIIKFDQINLK